MSKFIYSGLGAIGGLGIYYASKCKWHKSIIYDEKKNWYYRDYFTPTRCILRMMMCTYMTTATACTYFVTILDSNDKVKILNTSICMAPCVWIGLNLMYNECDNVCNVLNL
jgi:hypothetical protein